MRESIVIAAPAETVWPLVADPLRHGEWNEKVIAVDREGEGPVRLGEKFGMIYKMSREHESEVEVIACDPPRRVSFEHRTQWKGRELVAVETYEIDAGAGGVRLTQIIDLRRALPWWARALIAFIHRFGSPKGQPPLLRLRELAESTLSGNC